MRLKISFDPKHSPERVIDKLLRTQKALFEVKKFVWHEINRFLEHISYQNFLEQANSQRNAPSTIKRKEQAVKSKETLRRGASGETAVAKQQFVDKYGRMSGFFIDKLKHAPLGSTRFAIREVTTVGPVKNGFLNWGIDLTHFYQEYPKFIFDGALGGFDGEPGLISLNRGDLEVVRQILITQYFLPAIAMSTRKK